MRENRLRTLLNEGKPTIGTRVQSSWPTVIEMVGRSGQFDYFLAQPGNILFMASTRKAMSSFAAS